jgi:hypothetical protein
MISIIDSKKRTWRRSFRQAVSSIWRGERPADFHAGEEDKGAEREKEVEW